MAITAMRLQADAQPPLPGRHGGEHQLGLGRCIIGFGVLVVVPIDDAEIAQAHGQRPHGAVLVDVAHGDRGRCRTGASARSPPGRPAGNARRGPGRSRPRPRPAMCGSTSPRPATTACSRSPAGATYCRSVPFSRLIGAGSCLRSTLPLVSVGRLSTTSRYLGTMYSGRRAAQHLGDGGAVDRALAAVDDDVARHLGQAAAGDHVDGRRADAGVLHQHRLDLGQLDAEAADLHLSVDAAEELQEPVVRQAHHVVRAVQAVVCGLPGS